MSIEPAVASQLNWFANHPDFLERTWGRADLWLYYIVGQLEQRKMPRELALLPVIESAFEPYAYSRARAAGLWQFISDTGRRFGLKQDWWYDGRRDPIEATRAALDYLQALHDEFNGDWLLAIAAYNCGELAVERAIERNQRARQAHRFLASEAADRDPRLCARTAGDAPPGGQPGALWPGVQPHPERALLRRHLDRRPDRSAGRGRYRRHQRRGPVRAQSGVSSLGHRSDRPVPPAGAGGRRRRPAGQPAAAHARAAHARGHYTVRRGDTLATIASHFATKPEVIRELNDLDASDLPVIDSRAAGARSEHPAAREGRARRVLVDAPAGGCAAHGGRPNIHVVRRGDTLYALAQRLGTDVQTLAQINGLQAG